MKVRIGDSFFFFHYALKVRGGSAYDGERKLKEMFFCYSTYNKKKNWSIGRQLRRRVYRYRVDLSTVREFSR